MFGANFRAAREALGLSQREAARRLKVNQPFISQVETGLANLTIERMAVLARFVGKPLFELLRPAAGIESAEERPCGDGDHDATAAGRQIKTDRRRRP